MQAARAGGRHRAPEHTAAKPGRAQQGRAGNRAGQGKAGRGRAGPCFIGIGWSLLFLAATQNISFQETKQGL